MYIVLLVYSNKDILQHTYACKFCRDARYYLLRTAATIKLLVAGCGAYIPVTYARMSSGLVYRTWACIVSRQMIPKCCCPRPPEPAVQDRPASVHQAPASRRPYELYANASVNH